MNIRRLQGWALMVSALMLICSFFISYSFNEIDLYSSNLYSKLYGIFLIIANGIFIFGLPSIYAVQPQIGRWGIIGLILIAFPSFIYISHGLSIFAKELGYLNIIELLLLLPMFILWENIFLLLISDLGYIIVGWFTTQTARIPKWAGWLLVAYGILKIPSNFVWLFSAEESSGLVSIATASVGALALLAYGWQIARVQKAIITDTESAAEIKAPAVEAKISAPFIQNPIWLVVVFVLSGVTASAYAYITIQGQTRAQQGWTTFDENKNITTLAIDPQGRVWAAQQGYTIVELVSGETIEWPDVSGIYVSGFDEVKTMAFDHEGRLWIHTRNISLAVRETNGEWAHLDEGIFIEEIVVDGKGRVWARAASWLEVVPSKNNNQTSVPALRYPVCERISGVDVDQRGRVWALCDNTLKMLNENDEWLVMAELPTPKTRWEEWGDIVIDSKSQVWAGDSQNLQIIWPENTQKSYQMTYAQDFTLVADRQGRLWGFGFGASLLMIDPISDTTMEYHGSNSGLIPGRTSAITLDANRQQLWIANKNGLSVLNLDAELVSESDQKSNTFMKYFLLIALIIQVLFTAIILSAILWNFNMKRKGK